MPLIMALGTDFLGLRASPAKKVACWKPPNDHKMGIMESAIPVQIDFGVDATVLTSVDSTTIWALK